MWYVVVGANLGSALMVLPSFTSNDAGCSSTDSSFRLVLSVSLLHDTIIKHPIASNNRQFFMA